MDRRDLARSEALVWKAKPFWSVELDSICLSGCPNKFYQAWRQTLYGSIRINVLYLLESLWCEILIFACTSQDLNFEQIAWCIFQRVRITKNYKKVCKLNFYVASFQWTSYADSQNSNYDSTFVFLTLFQFELKHPFQFHEIFNFLQNIYVAFEIVEITHFKDMH